MPALPPGRATLIVVPIVVLSAMAVALGLVTVLDRAGVLPHLEGDRDRRPRVSDRVPAGAMVGALAVMGLWVLAWFVLLVVGLGILSG